MPNPTSPKRETVIVARGQEDQFDAFDAAWPELRGRLQVALSKRQENPKP